LKFVGEINNRMRGFYRNKYTTPDGSETRYGASTQFEVENKSFVLFFFVNGISFSLQIVVEHFHVGMNQISKQHLI
jgi:hypothetical protein